MSNAVKWALLAAGAVALIALVVALPFNQYIDMGQFGTLLTRLTVLAGDGFKNARGLINNFLTPFGRNVLTGLMVYLFGKWAITVAIKTVTWVYHFVFRG